MLLVPCIDEQHSITHTQKNGPKYFHFYQTFSPGLMGGLKTESGVCRHRIILCACPRASLAYQGFFVAQNGFKTLEKHEARVGDDLGICF